MPYYINENYLHGTITVHEADCGHCNNGRGPTGIGQPNHWLGPYRTEIAAHADALDIGLGVAYHSVCMPNVST